MKTATLSLKVSIPTFSLSSSDLRNLSKAVNSFSTESAENLLVMNPVASSFISSLSSVLWKTFLRRSTDLFFAFLSVMQFRDITFPRTAPTPKIAPSAAITIPQAFIFVPFDIFISFSVLIISNLGCFASPFNSFAVSGPPAFSII